MTGLFRSLVQPIGYKLRDDALRDAIRNYLYFNGTDQLGDFTTPWKPNGLPYQIAFRTYHVGSVPYINVALSATTHTDNNAGAFLGAPAVAAIDLDDNGISAVGAGALQLGVNDWIINYTDQGINGTVNGAALTPSSSEIPKSITMAPIAELGGNAAAGVYWPGRLQSLMLTDGSPLQGYEYVTGDGSIYSDLHNPILLDGGEAFTIRLSWEHSVQAGTQTLLASLDNDDGVFKLSVEADGDVFLTMGESGDTGTVRWDDAFDTIADGQRTPIRIEHDGSTGTQLFIGNLEIPKTSGSIASKIGSIGRFGANVNLNEDFYGAAGDLEITGTPYAERSGYHGYLPYGSSHPDVIDSFSATSVDDMGELGLSNPQYMTFDSIKGVKFNTGSGASWGASFTDNGSHDLKNDGYVLRFEVEKGLFDVNYTPALGTEALMIMITSGGLWEGMGRSKVTDNWVRVTYGPPPVEEANGFKTVNAAMDDFVEVEFEYDPAGPTLEMRVDGFTVQKLTIDDITGSDLTLSCAGLGGFGALYNHGFFMRNFQLVRYPRRLLREKSVAFTGDSIITFGQYMLDSPSDDNEPYYSGYDGTDYTEEACTALPWFYNRTMFGMFHKELALKGYQTPARGLDMFGAGGRSVYNWEGLSTPETWDWDERWKAIEGTTNYYPTPGLTDGRADYWVLSFTGNDVRVLNEGNVTRPENWLELFRSTYLTYLDNIIETGAERVFILSPTRLYYDFQEGAVKDTQTHQDDSEAFFEVLRGFNGYGGICVFVDVYTEMTRDMLIIDGIHPNSEGQRYLAEKIGEYLPSNTVLGETTYRYPMTKSNNNELAMLNTADSGAAFNAKWESPTWTMYDRNSRAYPINEGSGLNLTDYLHKGDEDYNIVMTNVNTGSGGWNYG